MPYTPPSRRRGGSSIVGTRDITGRSCVGAPAWAAVALAGAAAAAAQTWFRPGTLIASGDTFPVALLRPDAALAASRWIWGDGTTPTGGPDYEPALETLPALLGKTLSLVGVGPHGAQRVFLTLLFAALAPSMFLLLRRLLPGTGVVAPAVGALFYAFNPALFVIVPNPVLMTSLVLLPLLPALVLRAAPNRRWRDAVLVASASLPLSYAFLNPPAAALVVLATGAAAVLAVVRWRRAAGVFLGRAALAAAAFNAWWIAAVLVVALSPTFAVSADANPFSWSWTHERSSLANVARLTGTWGWPRPEYYPYGGRFDDAPLALMAFVPLLLTVAAPIVLWRRRRLLFGVAVGTIALAGVLILLGKGLHPPLAGVNAELYRHVPGMWLFREPAAKFAVVLAAAYAAGIALLLSGLRHGWRRGIGAGAAIAVITALAHPLWTGAVIPDERPQLPPAHVRIPAYWEDAARYVDEHGGRTLLLPANDYYQMPYTWGYYGADVVADELFEAPTIRLMPPEGNTYVDPEPHAAKLLAGLRRAIEGKRAAAAAELARRLGIRWVLVRGDIAPRFGDRQIGDAEALADFLVGAEGFRRAASFGPLELFEVEHGAPSLATSVLAVEGDASAAAEVGVVAEDPLVSASDVARTAIARRPFASLAPSEWVRDGNGIAAEVRGTRRDEAFVRWDQGTLATIRVGAAPVPNVAVVPARATLGRRKLPGAFGAVRFPLTEGVPHLVGVDDTLVAIPSSSRTRPRTLTLHPGRHEAVLYRLAATRTVAGGSFEVRGWGAVGDCNKSDARTPEQAGLAATRVPGGTDGGLALELRARAHSACVRRAAAGFRADSAYRLSLDYRHRRGAPPRVCVWQEGLERCVQAPALRPSRSWTTYSHVFRPEPGATGLAVYLYADGDARGTSILYDRVDLRRYDLVAREAFQIMPAWQPVGRLDAERRLALRAPFADSLGGFTDSFESGGWGAVGDCDRFDEHPPAEVGLAARRVRRSADGAFALALYASAHSACVSRTLRRFDPEATYRLSFDYLHLRGAGPRVCVWQERLARCRSLPPLVVRRGWRRYDETFRTDPGASRLTLYLYADGVPAGTAVLYDDVTLEPVQPFPRLALVGERRGIADRITGVVERVTPASYRVDVDRFPSGPFLVALRETFDPGWVLDAETAAPVRVDGFAQGWIVDRAAAGALRITYRPQRWVDAARTISGVALLIAATFAAAQLVRRVRTTWALHLGRRGGAAAAPERSPLHPSEQVGR